MHKPFVSALSPALERVEKLLMESETNYETLHSAKSVLYAAIEQAGLHVERFELLQRKLRELFSIINIKADLNEHELTQAKQIISDISAHYHYLLRRS